VSEVVFIQRTRFGRSIFRLRGTWWKSLPPISARIDGGDTIRSIASDYDIEARRML